MRRLAFIAAAVLAASAAPSAAAVLAASAAPSAVADSGYVTAPGGPSLRDPQGRVLQLHGVNLVAKCAADTHPADAPGSPCIPGAPAGDQQPGFVLTPDATDPGRRFTDADAATLERLGFTSVRLGIIWAGLEPGDPSIKPNDPRFCSPHAAGSPYPSLGAADPWDPAVAERYLEKVDVIVSLLEKHGIRPLIDMHQDAWGGAFTHPTGPTPWMGEGAPAWATCTDGGTTDSPSAGWGSSYFESPTIAAYNHFWANDVTGNLQGQFAKVWAFVARHFRENRGILGYEILNEPSDQTGVVPPEFDRKLECFYAGSKYAPNACRMASYPAPAQPLAEGVVPVVEKADPNHLVFVESGILGNDGLPSTFGATGELPFPNVVYSFHVYPIDVQAAPVLGSGPDPYACTEPTCPAEDERIIAHAAHVRAAMRTAQTGGPAWMLTEFGAASYAKDLDDVAAAAERYGLGWMNWAAFQLHDPTGAPAEGLIDDTTRQPDPARAAVLARTYPLATAGTPLVQRFDSSTGEFTFAYRPDPSIAAPTEIVVPTTVHYPRGYDVTVNGGQVTSAADSDRLTITANAGANIVVVRLTARLTETRPAARGSRSPRGSERQLGGARLL